MKMLNWVLVAVFTLYALVSPASASANSLGERTSILAKSTLGLAQDTAITTYIYAKLASHPSLANSSLDISTTAGKVILNGIVNDESQAQEVRQLAEKTAGVKAVDASRLIVTQQDAGLYIKSSTTPVTTTAPSTPPATLESSPQPLAPEPTATAAEPLVVPSEMKLSALDPLATQAALNQQPAKVEKFSQRAQKHSAHKCDKHKKKKKGVAAHKKSKHLAHKKPAHPSKKTLVKAKTHPHKIARRLAKHTPLLTKAFKQTKRQSTMEKLRPQVLSQKGDKESVDQMTNNFLKSALTANQPIPEE